MIQFLILNFWQQNKCAGTLYPSGDIFLSVLTHGAKMLQVVHSLWLFSAMESLILLFLALLESCLFCSSQSSEKEKMANLKNSKFWCCKAILSITVQVRGAQDLLSCLKCCVNTLLRRTMRR